MVVCAGCNGHFKSNLAHSIHLRRTRNLPCRAIFLQALDYLPQLSDSDPDIDDEQFLGIAHPRTWGEDPDVPAPHFAGDFFGDNYAEEDFEMLAMEDGVLPPDSDDENRDDFNQEQGWEEPAACNPSRSPSPEGEVFDNDEDIPTVEERRTAEARFLLKPTVLTFRDVFPQSTAGMYINDSVVTYSLLLQVHLPLPPPKCLAMQDTKINL
jgi:hypothetical protein